MIEGLETLLVAEKHPGTAELHALIAGLLDATRSTGRLVQTERLSRARVYRARFHVNGRARSLIVKRLPPYRSERECAAVRRWLPRAGLDAHAPPLLGVAAQRNGALFWHVYEDLGPYPLAGAIDDPLRVVAAIDVIAKVHVGFARHPLLAECRLAGGELGAAFFEASLRDACRNIEAVQRAVNVDARGCKAAAGLCERLANMVKQQPERMKLLRERGGPETLLHGDLWTKNILAIPGSTGVHVRLIDWDHCGVGPVVYDLSTFLRRFPLSQRPSVLDQYWTRLDSKHWPRPSLVDLNAMLDTVELARCANSITWRAVAILNAEPDAAPEWAIADLEEIDTWFGELSPVLPVDDAPDNRMESTAA